MNEIKRIIKSLQGGLKIEKISIPKKTMNLIYKEYFNKHPELINHISFESIPTSRRTFYYDGIKFIEHKNTKITVTYLP